jgi:hypothetical protein
LERAFSPLSGAIAALASAETKETQNCWHFLCRVLVTESGHLDVLTIYASFLPLSKKQEFINAYELLLTEFM